MLGGNRISSGSPKSTDQKPTRKRGRLMRHHPSTPNIVWTVLFSLLTTLSLSGCGDTNNVSALSGPTTPAAAGSLSITSSSLLIGVAGQPYADTVGGSGGTTPYLWSVSPALPPTLQLNQSSGTISGTPTGAREADYTFTLRDSSSPAVQVQRILHLSVVPRPPVLTILTPSLPPGTINEPYSEALQAAGGTAPLTWSLSAGSLPQNLNLDSSTGVISGTPTGTTASTLTFTVQVDDINGQSDVQPLSIRINLPAAPNITTTPLSPGTFNGAYNQTVSITGGVGPFVWVVTTGVLPPGLTLNPSNGNISGTATRAGSFTFTLRVTDSFPQSDQQDFRIDITAPSQPVITAPSSLPTGTVNQDYPNTTLTASGGTAPLTWDPLVSPALPNGLSWDATTHTISGRPLNGSHGTANHTFTVRDATNPVQAASRTYSLTINLPAPPSITTTSLPNGTVTQPYSRTVQATGGTPPFSWSFTATIPPGLNFDSSTGGISGTPTTPGTFNFTAQVTDALSQSATQPLSITIVLPAPPNITTSTLPNGTVASAYSQTVQASGGTGALVWSISAGSLPTGLNPINSATGHITGTPSAAGTFSFTVQATDTLNQSDDQPLSLTIDLPAPPNITTTTLPNGTAGAAYSTSVTATGGIGNLRWIISSPGTGPLPPGLDIDPDTGMISGDPTTPGIFPFTVQITDTIPQSDTQDLSITID
ncbi:MAG: hypothetical protein CAF44_016105 [Nitrospira sp. CG24D]|nr:MAG: hypothetical protein CAF44_016105 [Nitrospira sp. CG24D]